MAVEPAPNPSHIVAISDLSPQTLRELVAHLEVSTDFEHLVYRESELDALWSISGFALKFDLSPPDRAGIARLHDLVLVAHDLVADGRPREAAQVLRTCI